MAARRKRSGKAARLPSGLYGWRGRAVPFSKLPKSERARLRGTWAKKAKTTKKRERAIKARAPEASTKKRRAAREWLQRREKQIKQGASAKAILDTLGPEAVLAAKALQAKARRAYSAGQAASKYSKQITDALGEELAALMPLVWYYH